MPQDKGDRSPSKHRETNPELTSTTERRRRRARDVALALRYQLDACRGLGGMDALVVADQDGLCLAGSGPSETCHEIAAVLPFLGGRRGDFQGTVLSAKGGMRVMVRTVQF